MVNNTSNLKTGRRMNRQYHPTPRSKKERIGVPTGLMDKEGNEIMSGANVRIKPDYEGIVLYHRDMQSYGLFMGLWYGDKNPLDADCYGKFINIPADNGMRTAVLVKKITLKGELFDSPFLFLYAILEYNC